jgi:AcrR family transcriptional regulator
MATAPKSVKDTGTPVPVTREKLLQAALSETAILGWDLLTMRDVANAAGCSLAQVQAHFTDKFDLLVAFGRHLDHLTLARLGEPDPRLSTRERLFEALMERFDLMQEHRAAITSMFKSVRLDPKQALFSVPELSRSMAWLLEQAGLDTNGPKGLARVVGLSGVFLQGFRAWLDDDSADLAKTMAATDKALNQVERWAGTFNL